MKMFTTHSPEETEQIGYTIGAALNSPCVIRMYGELGAGKTTLIRGLCRGLGYTGEVSSPTFAIVHEYEGGRLPIYHFDMYRVETEEDLYSCGYYDYEGTGVLAVEWCENVEQALPADSMCIRIQYGVEENQRLIAVEGVEAI